MGSASRRKGLAGEREVAAFWEEHGYSVRGLEGEGDHLIIRAEPRYYDLSNTYGPNNVGYTIFSEVKRAEAMKMWQWLAQLEAEAPPGTLPLLSFRRNRSAWYGCAPLEALVKVLA